jgi:hypothetical protein
MEKQQIRKCLVNEHKLNMVSSMHREPLIQMKQYENKFLCKFSSISQFLRDVLLIVKLFTFNYIRVMYLFILKALSDSDIVYFGTGLSENIK